MKIKTLNQEWYGQMGLFCRFSDGPTVDIEESDVSSVESVCDHWCDDESLKAYVYRRNGLTICVAYTELYKHFPRLAQMAKESMIRKVNAPDPLRGSCS